MSSKSPDNKFSVVEDEQEDILRELEGFVKWIAWEKAEPAWDSLLDFEELVGELLLEVAKGMKYYHGKLNPDQMKAVLRKMVDNRISELKYRYHYTHRAVGAFNISVDVDLQLEQGSDEEVAESNHVDRISPTELPSSAEEMYESKERVMNLSASLSPKARTVFDALIFGNDRLGSLIIISAMRASAVYKNPSIKIRTHMLSDALCMSERDVRSAISEIKRKYDEVMNG